MWSRQGDGSGMESSLEAFITCTKPARMGESENIRGEFLNCVRKHRGSYYYPTIEACL